MRGTKRYRYGAWQLRVDSPPDPLTGKRRQIERAFHAPNTRAGAKAADVELAKLVVQASKGRAAARSGITVSELIELYIDDAAPSKGWSPGADDQVRQRVAKHITPHLGEAVADQLRPASIAAWHKKLRQHRYGNGRALSEATIGRVHDILLAALRWGQDHEIVFVERRNPAERRRPKGRKKRRKAPADAVMVALLNAADGDVLCYLRLAAVSGARRGTLVALRWTDINLDAATVTIERTLVKVRGGTAEKDTTKADVDYSLSLDPATVALLRAHRTRAAGRALAAGVSLLEDGFVFTRATTPDGRLPWHPDGANQRFNRIRAKVPGAEAVKPHQFRHWMATAMFEDGADPITVAGRGGWASPAVPLAIYGHKRPAPDRAAAKSLAKRLDRVSDESGGPRRSRRRD